MRLSGRAPRTRSVLLAAGVLSVGITSIGVAATGNPLREGQRNGTATRETQIVARVDATSATTGGYATRQSNLSSSGGGAIYGCRSTAGSSTGTPPKNPCVRVNNLSNGLAFEFNAVDGLIGGTVNVGPGGDTRKPFTTNATGVATGLNADRVDGANASEIVATARAKAGLDADTVDGASASDLRTRWFTLDEAGQIVEQSGGFTVVDAYQTNQNVYVDSGATLAGRGLTASIAIQNKIDQTADGVADPNFGGEVSVARCQTAAVECAPPVAKTVNALVVSPRNSDGTATAAGARKRVTVLVTE